MPQEVTLTDIAPQPGIAYIGLGSNLGDRRANLCAAANAIGRLANVSLRRRSGLYESPAQDVPSAQPDYLNAVLEIRTSLTPNALWSALAEIERQLGRVRPANQVNAPRTIDLDLLLYDDVRLDSAELTLPHPRILTRAFVVTPLRELGVEKVGSVALATHRLPAHSIATRSKFRWL